MDDDRVKKEHAVLSTTPMVAGWIRENKQLGENEFDMLIKLFPNQLQFGMTTPFEELIEMNKRYRDSKLYGKDIEVLLSPSGIQWLREHYDKMQKYLKVKQVIK